jgi:hypothetical protein
MSGPMGSSRCGLTESARRGYIGYVGYIVGKVNQNSHLD